MVKLIAKFMFVMTILAALLLTGCGTDGEGQAVTETGLEQTTPPESDAEVSEDIDISTYSALNYDDMKAMWLSQYDLSSVYCEGAVQRSEPSFTSRIKTVLSNVKSLGFNTVIVQVRPFADSMYPSEFYPMSSMVVGSYGKDAAYDPFAIVVEQAHDLGLSVQAWINPMRAMLDSEIAAVDDRFLIKQWYEDSTLRGKYIVECGGRWYLNVAYEPVRQLIIDGAREIVEKYNVDGLHMDDYFYPTTEASFDAAAYVAYLGGGGELNRESWRRQQLNLLVSGLWRMVKAYDTGLIFGISPAGNYNTVYNSQYADIYTWCAQEGYIDYICPQVYFGFEHGSCDFIKVSNAYRNMIKTDKVKLIIGMTLGKALSGSNGAEDKWAGDGKREWIENQDVLLRSLEYTRRLPECSGVAYFCYQYFFSPVSDKEVAGTQAERDNFLPLLKTISWK